MLCCNFGGVLGFMSRVSEDLKDAYLCDIRNNSKCDKSMCIMNGGPCMFTSDKKYAFRGIINVEPYSKDDLMEWATHVGCPEG